MITLPVPVTVTNWRDNNYSVKQTSRFLPSGAGVVLSATGNCNRCAWRHVSAVRYASVVMSRAAVVSPHNNEAINVITYQCARCHGVPQTGILHSALWLHDITNMHGITGYRKLYYYTVCCWQQLLIICTVARFGSMGYRKLDYYIMCCWCGRRQGNVTSRHIDRLAAPTCCAVHVLTSRSSLTCPWWISPRSSIIC